MKQNITKDQLNELTDKAKDRLNKWWKPKEGDRFYTTDPHSFIGLDEEIKESIVCPEMQWDEESFVTVNDDLGKDYYPLLSIGQMIEFLDEYKQNKEWKIEKTTYDERGGWFWSVDGKKQYVRSLCDALFEAVKEILERENGNG